jgi:ribosomal-protein-alanine N-acetyltransferase
MSSTLGEQVVPSDWQHSVPVLQGERLMLRELRQDDAASLHTMINTDEVSRFITAPSSTLEGFEEFIAFTHQERAASRLVCFGIVPQGLSSAIGVFQVRAKDGEFTTAEWGFAMGSPFWGTGVFVEGAQLVLDFAFGIAGVHRLEARAVVANGRANGALRKLGAVREGLLRRSFQRDGAYYDQLLWAILAEDWQAQRREPRALLH